MQCSESSLFSAMCMNMCKGCNGPLYTTKSALLTNLSKHHVFAFIYFKFWHEFANVTLTLALYDLESLPYSEECISMPKWKWLGQTLVECIWQFWILWLTGEPHLLTLATPPIALSTTNRNEPYLPLPTQPKSVFVLPAREGWKAELA